MWGATFYGDFKDYYAVFQLTLPVWGATMRTFVVINFRDISTHAPRVGSDQRETAADILHDLFQLTLPVWGATKVSQHRRVRDIFQLTLPVWGATVGSRA